MSESLTWKPCRLREDDLLEKLKAADGDHNQSLRDLEDHLPQISCGGEAGALLVSPEIQSRYQKLLAGDSQNTSEGDVVILAPDPSKKELQSLEIVDLMRRNGGHLLKLGDLARLFPKAKLGGKGLPLEKLVADDIVLKTKQFPQGISLGESYVDPGGELIVSHLYQQELRENAPSFTQFMTNYRVRQGKPHKNLDCHDATKAFKTKECSPDSWPLDADTLLSQGSLAVPLGSDYPMPPGLQGKRLRLIGSLFYSGFSLRGIKRSKVGLEINLRNAPDVRDVLLFLNQKIPELHCDPMNQKEMAAYLGGDALKGRLDGGVWRRVLALLFDDPSVALFYDDQKANDPSYFNRQTGKPSLHFTARISPMAPEEVKFSIYHIDAQSYHPRGWHYGRSIDGPDVRPYQHQGEVEPLYLLFDRTSQSGKLKLLRVYFGDHLIAEPLEGNNYKGEISVAYGSGGRIPLPEETVLLPGAMFRAGTRSAAAASVSTWFPDVPWFFKKFNFRLRRGIFPFVEVYPGRKDLEGPSPMAARFEPDAGYRVIIEGQNGDFLPTGRLLARDGKSQDSDELNEGGFPFARGAGKDGTTSEHQRTAINIHDFLRRQDDVCEGV